MMARRAGWRAATVTGWRILTVAVVASVFTCSAGVTVTLAPAASLPGFGAFGPDQADDRTTWVDALVPAVRDTGIQNLLDRRAKAVLARDRTAFLSDVDNADPQFARRQGVVFDNLIALPLAELTFQLEPTVRFRGIVPERLSDRFRTAVHAPGVTIRYRVTGVDSRPVAAPWVPVLGYREGRWLIAGEPEAERLPYGANGQVWDAGPIAVVQSPRVVGVFSAEDTGRAGYLLQAAERGLDRVAAVRGSGWDGKVVLTAIQDQRIFDAYFVEAPDRVANVAAIAVPFYQQVPDWHPAAAFATVRVMFNPQQLSAQPEELAHDVTHEFAHAAMGPVTIKQTPRWLVEGFAEYVAYRGEAIPPTGLRRLLKDVPVAESLPASESFYADSKNYLTSWLACRMIAEQYGEQRLITLYDAFGKRADQDANVQEVLGVSLASLTAQWRGYLQRLKA